MFQLLIMGLALFGLFKLAKEPAVSAELTKLSNVPIPPWPALSSGLGQGKHFFFSLPMIKPDAKLLATALTALGWQDVKVWTPGMSLSNAPTPRPAEWQGAAGQTLVSGRWTGQSGAPIDVSTLGPLGLDTTGATGKTMVWISTEDYVTLHAQRL